MQPKTEEFLYAMQWAMDLAFRPTFRNLTDSYEQWAYRNNFLRQIQKLEAKRLIEPDPTAPDQRIYRLTEQGRLRALGGRDPEIWWSRAWDGMWRLVLFDIPEGQSEYRERLWRYLRTHCFGFLQNSVWITPDPLHQQREWMAGSKIDVESLIFLEARPCADESDEQIVAGAWDFNRINHRYARHQKILDEHPAGPLRTPAEANALRRWAAAERRAWLDAVSIDPLLPERLLPAGYLGRETWQRRKEIFRRAGRQLQSFKP